MKRREDTHWQSRQNEEQQHRCRVADSGSCALSRADTGVYDGVSYLLHACYLAVFPHLVSPPPSLDCCTTDFLSSLEQGLNTPRLGAALLAVRVRSKKARGFITSGSLRTENGAYAAHLRTASAKTTAKDMPLLYQVPGSHLSAKHDRTCLQWPGIIVTGADMGIFMRQASILQASWRTE